MQEIIFAVYTLTPKGGFSQRYEGPDFNAALKVYGKLARNDKSRAIVKRENHLTTLIERSLDFPQ